MALKESSMLIDSDVNNLEIYADVHFLRGNIYQEMGNHRAASYDFSMARNYDPATY